MIIVNMTYNILYSFIYDNRRNSEFISAIKSNNIQALMTPKIKNERDDLLLYKYIECKTIPNCPEGNIIIPHNICH